MGQHVKINYDPKFTFNPNPPKHRAETQLPVSGTPDASAIDVWSHVSDKDD